MIGALEKVARRQQALLRPLLGRLLADRRLVRVEAVTIVNRLLVEGTAAGILHLAADPLVARVMPEWTSAPGPAGLALVSPEGAPAPGERFRSWAVEAVYSRAF